MNILLIGSGVIGSVYAGQVGLAGHKLFVLAHGERERYVAANGIGLHDVGTGQIANTRAELAKTADNVVYDLVIVAVQAGQLDSTFPALRKLLGKPHVVIFGNNPAGHEAIPSDLPGTLELGFPGIGGYIKNGIAEYTHIPEQPTTLEVTTSATSLELQSILAARGFKTRRTPYIDGWLSFHAVLISCISMAILRAGTDTVKLGNDNTTLRLMCRAIEEGFGELKSSNVKGLPINLSVLHSPLLRPIAMWYWGKTFRSPKGELYFGSHIRHSQAEVDVLSSWVLVNVVRDSSSMTSLRSLMAPRDSA